MKAITTKYYGPTNTRGSRIVATDSDGNKATVGYDHALNSEGNHKEAAIALCDKMSWSGTLHGGHTKAGMVFVFEGSIAFNV